MRSAWLAIIAICAAGSIAHAQEVEHAPEIPCGGSPPEGQPMMSVPSVRKVVCPMGRRRVSCCVTPGRGSCHDGFLSAGGLGSVASPRTSHFGTDGPIPLFNSLIESAKLCGVEACAYPREATPRAVRDPGAVTSLANSSPRNPEVSKRLTFRKRVEENGRGPATTRQREGSQCRATQDFSFQL